MTGTDVFYGLGLLIVFLASPKDLNQVPHLSWISEMMLTLSKCTLTSSSKKLRSYTWWWIKIQSIAVNVIKPQSGQCYRTKPKTYWPYRTLIVSFSWREGRLVKNFHALYYIYCKNKGSLQLKLSSYLNHGLLHYTMRSATKWASSSTSVKQPDFIGSSGTVSIYICHTDFVFSF